jgi:hypothetical protein
LHSFVVIFSLVAKRCRCCLLLLLLSLSAPLGSLSLLPFLQGPRLCCRLLLLLLLPL